MQFFQKLKARLQGRPWVDKQKLKRCGFGVVIESDCSFFHPETIEIGDYTYVGPWAYWYGNGGIQIHDRVIFGPHTVIWSSSHNWQSKQCLPYGPDEILEPVVLEQLVWVCHGVQILPGVRVGEGAVLGMGAVVTKDVPPLAVVGGNPATIVAHRNKNEYEDLKAKGKYLVDEKYRYTHNGRILKP